MLNRLSELALTHSLTGDCLLVSSIRAIILTLYLTNNKRHIFGAFFFFLAHVWSKKLIEESSKVKKKDKMYETGWV